MLLVLREKDYILYFYLFLNFKKNLMCVATIKIVLFTLAPLFATNFLYKNQNPGCSGTKFICETLLSEIPDLHPNTALLATSHMVQH